MKKQKLPGQVVLVLQGGGALGAYQVGVYQAMQEAGIEPDWVIGTSIGAINGAIIAGNAPAQRLPRLHDFWQRIENGKTGWGGFANSFVSNFSTVMQGIPAFFVPRLPFWGGLQAEVGLDRASYYSTEPLRETLSDLVDFDRLDGKGTRLSVGAVSVTGGEMRYFDSRREPLCLEHVMASGALPPAFPAVRIDGNAYWDGGVYSNTPIEAVFDDNPRRDSVIFAVNVWQPSGPEPGSLWQVMGRQKDIQYASRADSHVARQKQIHRLRHVIRELERRLPDDRRNSSEVRELASWGCGTTVHVLRLLAPALTSEDLMKDLDFSASGIRARCEAGHADAARVIKAAPWEETPADPIEGVIVHELSARTGG